MNKVLIYGSSIVGLGAIAYLCKDDPKAGAIAALGLILVVLLVPKIKEIKSLKASKDGIEINEDDKDAKP